MPLIVPVTELIDGMVLSEPIFLAGTTMVPAGSVLTPGHVQQIREQLPHILCHIDAPRIDRIIGNSHSQTSREPARVVQQQIMRTMQDIWQRLETLAVITPDDYHAIRITVEQVIRFIAEHRDTPAVVHEHLNVGHYLSEHAARVFFLAMKLGLHAESYVQSQRPQTAITAGSVNQYFSMLGIGAILCDLGMWPIQDLFNQDRALDEHQRHKVIHHPAVGEQMLPPTASSIVRAIVRTHHENATGTGYPLGLRLEQIHILARVVRIADSFDAATCRHVFDDAKHPIEALWEMSVGPHRSYYDPQLMAHFRSMIQPLPIGAQIRMTDGSRAVITQYDRHDGLDPELAITHDRHGQPIHFGAQPKRYYLSQCPDQCRPESFGKLSLRFLTDPPADPPQPLQGHTWTGPMSIMHP